MDKILNFAHKRAKRRWDIGIEWSTKYENLNCFSKVMAIPNVALYKMTIKSQDNIDIIVIHFILMDNAQMNAYIYIYIYKLNQVSLDNR